MASKQQLEKEIELLEERITELEYAPEKSVEALELTLSYLKALQGYTTQEEWNPHQLRFQLAQVAVKVGQLKDNLQEWYTQ